MNILIISFYYEPDLGAGSFRAASFVEALKARLTNVDSIEVITTLPNRYASFKVESKESESKGNVTVKRIKVPFHRNGFFDQARSFFLYFIGVLKYVRGRRYDAVFATSGRLFSAFLASIIARQKNIPLYLDIRDIFTETIRYILADSKAKYMMPLFLFVEKITVSKANKINLVSRGFDSYFRNKYKKQYSFFSNGIDDVFLHFNYNGSELRSRGKIVFTYVGNIGEGQGLEKIIPYIAERYSNLKFYVIGDGGRRRVLEKRVSHLQNVKLLKPVNREKLVEFYRNTDALFLQLNDYKVFRSVLPSKIFEYAATFKPIIAGVDGYAKEFLEEHLPDSLIFKPCDFGDFCRKYNSFTGIVDAEKRKRFIAGFLRREIMDKMARDFLEVVA